MFNYLVKKTESVFILFFVLLLAISPLSLKAQDLQSTLQMMSDQAAKAYLKPASNGFGADLNSGWFSKAPKSVVLDFDVQLGLVAMGAFLPGDNKTFLINGSFRFTPDQAQLMTQSIANQYGSDAQLSLINQLTSRDFNVQISGPTIIGSKNDYMKVNFYGTTLSYQPQPGQPAQDIYVPPQEIPIQEIKGVLDNMSILPFGAPQLTLGTVYGTQVLFRYLPPTEINADLGKADYFGFGIEHNIGVWVPLPLDITLGYFTQSLKVGDIIKSRADEYGIYASKSIGAGGAFGITPYAGLTLQSSTMDVSYNYLYQSQGVEVPTNISFQLKGENSGKLVLGVAFNLSVVSLNFEYNVAKFSSIGGGLGLNF
ncbi:MAG TPA: DUF6588 family protein [Ignavibacteriales bacterium]|nr:DUF6588 family protein [Ignavibacteriales bacterium]